MRAQESKESFKAPSGPRRRALCCQQTFDFVYFLCKNSKKYKNFMEIIRIVWGDRIFEKCGIRRDEEGDGGKTLEIRGKRRLSARDGGANYQQS